MKNNFKIKGFILIETILYVAVAAIMLTVFSYTAIFLLQIRVKTATIAEVEQHGAAVINTITQAIRNSSSIARPSLGMGASSLELNMASSSVNPTIFNVNSGTLYIKVGLADPINLTNRLVSVQNILFTNLSPNAASGAVRVKLTLARVNPEGRNEYSYEKTFYSSAALRE